MLYPIVLDIDEKLIYNILSMSKELATSIRSSGDINIRILRTIIPNERGQFNGEKITIFPQLNNNARRVPSADILHKLSLMRQVVNISIMDFVNKTGRKYTEQGKAIGRILDTFDEQMPKGFQVFQIEADPDGPIGDAIRECAEVDFDDFNHKPLTKPYYNRRK